MSEAAVLFFATNLYLEPNLALNAKLYFNLLKMGIFPYAIVDSIFLLAQLVATSFVAEFAASLLLEQFIVYELIWFGK